MTTTTREISNIDDVIDVRDVIARVEELEELKQGTKELVERDGLENTTDWTDDEEQELVTLQALLEDLEGNGGDEQWRGSWYPVTLIRDSYFEDYARAFADDIGAINAESVWPNNHIDWKAAAEELQGDYSTTSFDGIDYHYR